MHRRDELYVANFYTARRDGPLRSWCNVNYFSAQIVLYESGRDRGLFPVAIFAGF